MPDETIPVPKEQASSLLKLALFIPFAKKIVGSGKNKGIRFVFLPGFAIESYTCNEEPLLESWKGIRFVLWKTFHTENITKGWKKWRGVPIGNTHAVSRVHKDFLKDWKDNARRLVMHPPENFHIQKASVKEFAKAYHKSGYLDFFLRYGFIKVIKDHLKVHPEDVSVLLFAKGETLLGGTVFVDYPEIKQSHYLISFLTKEGREHSIGYQFIYWWYQDMLKKGLEYADFGIVWQKGDPLSWRGYSEFKKKFSPKFYTKVAFWKRG